VQVRFLTGPLAEPRRFNDLPPSSSDAPAPGSEDKARLESLGVSIAEGVALPPEVIRQILDLVSQAVTD
jgi:hypothetical protein